ncbi:DUF3139 domain-containing protein [Oceanobacillus sojae]|uniref:DUF3139 domain-containing protein n=1 Tax=Oceanobacillus sojae TaxID=582851 RepID=A0A511ZPD9_9BACI|nr:DUF3139 domain-containing protein [Oceanobacillus sojae]GEN89301.1 hypothetical protein OSO01_40400 [Oceanobacillus sojae]
MSITKSKKARNILIIIIVLVLLIGGTVFMFFYNKKKESTEIIDSYITENNYEDLIKEKEIVFDSKQGNYNAEIIFKDEPENFYEFYVEPSTNKVNVAAFDSENVEITDKSKAKYIND